MTNETKVAQVETIAPAAPTAAVPARKPRAVRTSKPKPKKRTRRAFGGTILELKHRPGTLWGRYADPLTRKRKTVKLVEGTDEAAWKKAEIALQDIIRGEQSRDPANEERRGVTLAEFLFEFMPQPSVAKPSRPEDESEESRREWKQYRKARHVANEEAALSLAVGVRHAEDLRSRLDRVAEFFDTVPVAAIDKAKAEKCLAALARADGRARLVATGKDKDGEEITKKVTPKLSAATRARYVAALSKCWGKAIETNATKINPWTAVRPPKGQKYAPRFLTRDEVDRVLAHLPDVHRPLFAFLAETGMRLGEAQRLTWQRVAPDFARVTVEQSKSGEPRVVDCTAAVRKILEDRRRSALAHGPDPVFVSRERTYLWSVWQRACIAAEVGRGVRIHDLRHYVGSSLAQAGVPLSTVQKILGHKSARMTEIYASHVPTSATAAAFAAWDAARVRSDKPRAKTTNSA